MLYNPRYVSRRTSISLSSQFIYIVCSAREAQCQSRARHELLRNRLNYSQDYLVSSRCSSVPRRHIMRALHMTAGSREAISAAGSTCCSAAFDIFGQGFLYVSDGTRVIVRTPGFHIELSQLETYVSLILPAHSNNAVSPASWFTFIISMWSSCLAILSHALRFRNVRFVFHFRV